MVMLMPGLAKREDRLPFAIGPRAQVVPPTVLGAPVTFVERGVGRAFGRTEAFPDASVVSVVLAESAALVRTIHVVRKELAVPVLLALRLAGLHGQCAMDIHRGRSSARIAALQRSLLYCWARRVRRSSRFGFLPLPGQASFAATASCRHSRKKKLAQARMALKVGLSVRSSGQNFASDRM